MGPRRGAAIAQRSARRSGGCEARCCAARRGAPEGPHPGRAEEIGAGIERRVDDLLDAWERIAAEAAQKGRGSSTGNEVPAGPPLLCTRRSIPI